MSWPAEETDCRVCEECLQPHGQHANTCPYGEHPSWERDYAPDQRSKEEDRVFGDPREREVFGP